MNLSIYYIAPVILLLLGLVLYLPGGNPKRERIGWVLTLIALVVLALEFLSTHAHHLIGKWPA